MRHRSLLLALALSVPFFASAEPQRGQTMPTFSVNDIAGSAHTQRDLTGRWSVLFVMTDKDTSPHVGPWFRRVRPVAPDARLITMAALDLFALVPTATIVSQARENTPRAGWGNVWLSRDGSLAQSLGLPESEVPWVIVVSPAGRVVEMVHSTLNDNAFARITAALPPPAAPPAPAAPAAPVAQTESR
jgi:hypothetical protein